MDRNDALENIQCFASKSFQERVWLKGQGPEEDSFVEAGEMYYSSIPKKEKEALLRLKTSFNNAEIDVIMKFHKILNFFIDKNGWDLGHEELLKSTDWLNIREEAKKVCEYFGLEPLK